MSNRNLNRNIVITCSQCGANCRSDNRGRVERLKHNVKGILETDLCNSCYILRYQGDPQRVKPIPVRKIKAPRKRDDKSTRKKA
jgi:hypothetical protein